MNKEQTNRIRKRTGFPLNQECYIITKEEFDELVNSERNIKELEKYKALENKLGCPLEIIDRLIEQNKVVIKFHGEIQVYNSIKIDLRNKLIWYCRQTGGHYALRLPLSQYKIHFWLKEDLSE